MKSLKKFMAVLLVGSLVFTGCTSGKGETKQEETKKTTQNESSNKVIKIGVSQIAVHSALDSVRKGFEDEFKTNDIKVEFIEKNAQGDIANSNLIAQKFVKDGVDMIFAIGTPSAQAAKTATNQIPILFSAVTDPVKAELVKVEKCMIFEDSKTPNDANIEDKNISGTTDATPIKKQLELFKKIRSDIKNIGIVYNTAEVNSVVQVDKATKFAKELGMNIVAKGITNINEMPQALDSLVGKVDGIYTITDNLVANAIQSVAEKAKENKIITVGAERAHVEGGILITDGINYYDLGKHTAKMAKQVLIDKKDIATMPVEKLEETEKVINGKTLLDLGLNKEENIFQGAEVLEK